MEKIDNGFAKYRLYIWLAVLALFFVPFERIPTWDVAGVTVKITGLVVLLYGLIFIPQIFSKNNWRNLNFLDKSLLGYLLVVLISVVVAHDRTRALTVTALIGVCLLAYHLFSRLPKTANWSLIQRVVVLSGVVTSLFGLYQFIGDTLGLPFKYTGLITPYTKLVLGFPRLQSVGHEPLYFANFLLFPLAILIWNAVLKEKIFNKYLDWLFLLVVILALTLTVSRGAFIAIGIGALFCLAVMLNQKLFSWRAVGKIALVSFLAIVIALGIINFSSKHNSTAGSRSGVQTFTKQVTVQELGSQGSSADQRLANWIEAWRLFKTSPIVGIGIGNYGKVNRVETDLKANPNPIVNNLYLEILAETGVLGFAVLASGLAYLLWKLAKNVVRNKEHTASLIMITTIVAILAQVVFFSTIYILYFWAVLGISGWLIRSGGDEQAT